MKANGLTIKLTDVEHISISMEPNILVSGLKTSSTAMALKHGLMEPVMKETTNTAKNTVLEPSNGQTHLCSLVNFSITISMEKVFTCGVMAGNTKETGKTTRCMVKARSHGVMVASIWVNMWMTRKMDMESSSGQTEGHTKETGRMANNMAMACT